jgi:hypothetical protein
MTKSILFTANLFLITTFGFLNASLMATEEDRSSYRSGIELQQGYRREKFDFQGGSKHSQSGLRSKLRSKHVNVYSSRLLFKSTGDNGVFLQGAVGYGHVLRGQAHFIEHRRKQGQETRHNTHLHPSGDYTWDLAFFLGKELYGSDGFRLSPKIGYSYYHQNFHFKHAVEKEPQHKRLRGFHAKYKANWYAPQIGIRAEKDLTTSFQLFADYAFLWPVKYRATGTTTKRHHGAFHFHNADKQRRSWGQIGVIGAKYTFTPHWSLNLEYELSKFHARKGHQRIAHRNVHLHNAHRSTSDIRLALCYNF